MALKLTISENKHLGYTKHYYLIWNVSLWRWYSRKCLSLCYNTI